MIIRLYVMIWMHKEIGTIGPLIYKLFNAILQYEMEVLLME